MWSRWLEFWREKLWNFRLEGLPFWERSWYYLLRLVSLSCRGFFKDLCTMRASSLTYYTLMSIVPMIALLFAVAKGFGYQEKIREQLLQQFAEHQTALLEIMNFADRALLQTSGGPLAVFGIIVLIWTSYNMIASMEAAVNDIWNVHNLRAFRRIVSDYLSLLLVTPLLYFVANSAVAYVAASVPFFLLKLVPYALFWCFFAFLYYFLPNAKVAVRSAFIGGITAGTLYIVVQWGYFYFQLGVSRYGAIYGSLAALPLFLLWVQASWFIFLYGAEMCYAHQTLPNHEFEPLMKKASPQFRNLLKLWILRLAYIRFAEAKQPLTVLYLIKQVRLPSAIAQPIADELVSAGLLMRVEGGYVPGQAELHIAEALARIEQQGLNEMPFIHSKDLAQFEKAFASFAELIEKSPANALIYES